ncbi:MAG: hypothetical protein U5L45_06175 [Saprospiraceae bacterium]|nr:hypothetical protein [Saprospiraceae bacterium]
MVRFSDKARKMNHFFDIFYTHFQLLTFDKEIQQFNYLAHSSLRSQKKGMWFVFRAKPKKRTTSSLSCERSERVTK